jgi:GNAT superfamily N-acetyltransferase
VWKPDDLHTIVCRPALPKDTPDVIELTRTIWEGHDYVPQVWEDWLADPEGLLAVAEYAGRAVGVVKLTHLSPGEWWLEGLRVDPKFQGQHIASHMHEYIVDYWDRLGDGTLRLTTYRPQVKKLCERTGFTSRCELTPYLAPVLEGLVEDFTPAEPGEATRAREFALESPVFGYSAGMMETGWRWVNPTLPLLEAAASEGRAWWWQGDRGLIILREDEESVEGGQGKMWLWSRLWWTR